MSEEKPGLKDGRQRPVYRALVNVILNRQRMYPAGSILDLSHLPQESIREMIRLGMYETADGEPENEPLGEPPPPCKNC